MRSLFVLTALCCPVPAVFGRASTPKAGAPAAAEPEAGDGSAPERAVKVCGPRDSYNYLGRFRPCVACRVCSI
jgi:hypothetical protein